MKPVSNDELLSAYLDGEGSPDELQRAELLIKNDPTARAAFDEMRAIRGGIQSLAAHRLNLDLTDQVLQAAEREMLTGEPPRAGSSRQILTTAKSLRRRFLQPRALVWSGTVIIVAIFLSLHESGTDQPADQSAIALQQEDSSNNATPEFRPAIDPPPIPMSIPAEERQPSPELTPADPMESPLVVRCEVSPDVAQKQALQQILARQKAKWSKSSGETRDDLIFETQLTEAALEEVVRVLGKRPTEFMNLDVPKSLTAEAETEEPADATADEDASQISVRFELTIVRPEAP